MSALAWYTPFWSLWSWLPSQVVVMSATLDASHFVRFFGDAAALAIPGRAYPVEVLYTMEPPCSDHVRAALMTCLQLHEDCPAGDVLVFLPGQVQVLRAKLLRDRYKYLGKRYLGPGTST